MLKTEQNVVDVREEDRDFIRELTLISSEKKLLIKGILIGMGLQEKPENVYGHNQQVETRQLSIMDYAGEKIM